MDNPDLTPVGEGMGTMAYVSPEQAREARQASIASDMYGLGATLYHLLCGVPPFQPKSANDLFTLLATTPPTPESYELETPIPHQLSEFVMAMLAKAPAERPSPPSFVAKILHDLRSELFPNSAQVTPATGKSEVQPGADKGDVQRDAPWETGETPRVKARELRKPTS